METGYKHRRDKLKVTSHPPAGTPNNPAAPICQKHNEPMVLRFYTRPGGPPGNGWSCPKCAVGPFHPHKPEAPLTREILEDKLDRFDKAMEEFPDKAKPEAEKGEQLPERAFDIDFEEHPQWFREQPKLIFTLAQNMIARMKKASQPLDTAQPVKQLDILRGLIEQRLREREPHAYAWSEPCKIVSDIIGGFIPLPEPSDTAQLRERIVQALRQHDLVMWPSQWKCRCGMWAISGSTDETVRGKLWAEHAADAIIAVVRGKGSQ